MFTSEYTVAANKATSGTFKLGDPVYFNGTQIGSVSSITGDQYNIIVQPTYSYLIGQYNSYSVGSTVVYQPIKLDWEVGI